MEGSKGKIGVEEVDSNSIGKEECMDNEYG